MSDNIEDNETVFEETEGKPKKSHRTSRSRKIRNRSYKTLATFIMWSAFVSIWLFFFAIDFTIIENASMIVATLIWFGGMNGVIWTPEKIGPSGTGRRTRISIFVSVTWVALMILWFPFFADPFTGYQNTALIITAFLIFIGIVGGMWLNAVPGPMGEERSSMIGSMAIFLIWMIFLVIWLWFFAEGYQLEQNIAIGILSTILAFGLIFGIIYKTSLKTDRMNVEGVAEVGLFLAWLLLLVGWFWFLAVDFNIYQNFAIVFISFIIFAGIAFLRGRKKWSSIEDLDFDDE